MYQKKVRRRDGVLQMHHSDDKKSIKTKLKIFRGGLNIYFTFFNYFTIVITFLLIINLLMLIFYFAILIKIEGLFYFSGTKEKNLYYFFSFFSSFCCFFPIDSFEGKNLKVDKYRVSRYVNRMLK